MAFHRNATTFTAFLPIMPTAEAQKQHIPNEKKVNRNGASYHISTQPRKTLPLEVEDDSRISGPETPSPVECHQLHCCKKSLASA